MNHQPWKFFILYPIDIPTFHLFLVALVAGSILAAGPALANGGGGNGPVAPKRFAAQSSPSIRAGKTGVEGKVGGYALETGVKKRGISNKRRDKVLADAKARALADAAKK